MPKAMRQMLSVQATPDVTGIRTAELYGQDYTVIPCIALCEGVLWPANASAPELALAEEFGRFPAGWNGRPVVYDHPKDADGLAISASAPDVLETNSFGQLFNTLVEDGKLKTEIWINNARVAAMSDEAQAVIADLQTEDNVVEVSTGLFTMSEMVEGTFKGQEFSAVWRNIVPDHLAVLPKGIKGACSVEDGCGAPRTNEMQPVMRAAQMRTENSECSCDEHFTKEEQSLLRRFMSKAASLLASDSADDEVHSVQESSSEDESTSNNIQENAMNEELVNGLIANESTQFTEDDREWLMALEEDQLNRLAPVVNEEVTESAVDEGSTINEDNSVVDEPATNTRKAVTTDEYIADAPAEVREVLEQGLRMHADRKATLIKSLTDNSRCKFTEEYLQQRSIAELESLVELAGTEATFVGNGANISSNSEADDDAPPPAPTIFNRNTEDKE